jgi:DUF218 domain-containing protein
VSRPRLIAVCGYSDARRPGLHAVCVERLRQAERLAEPGDVVLLSGWARRGGTSEAELMAEAWSATCRELVVDNHARSTVENVRSAARVARAVDAAQVVLVTSGWHARRAHALLRRALRGSGRSARVAAVGGRPPPGTRLRELACWVFVPFAAPGRDQPSAPGITARTVEGVTSSDSARPVRRKTGTSSAASGGLNR